MASLAPLGDFSGKKVMGKALRLHSNSQRMEEEQAHFLHGALGGTERNQWCNSRKPSFLPYSAVDRLAKQ